MPRDQWVFVNGDFIRFEEAKVPLMSHSFSRGSAIFEVMSFHETDTGPAVFRLDAHVERLARSAEALQMSLPYPLEKIREAVLATVRKNGHSAGIVKLFAYSSEITFTLALPDKPVDICIAAVDPDFYRKGIEPAPFISVCISKWRKLHPETVPIEAKASANYLNGLVALQDARKRGFDLGLMLDTEGFIAEGGTESFFLVKDGELLTPILGTVLQGISRKSILEAALAIDVPVRQGRLRPSLLMEAEEIFTASSTKKILPVGRIENRDMGEIPGPVTRKLRGLFAGILAGREPRFRHWLFPA
jgi:branched-chain amino acid aminotransferase